MHKNDERAAGHAGRVIVAAIAAALTVLLASCATAPPPAEPTRLVWPAPPLTTRIEFVRSVVSDEDLYRDTTFGQRLANFLGGEKPTPNRIAEPMGLAVSDDGNRVYVADYAQHAVFVFDFAQKTFLKIGKEAPLAQPVGLALDADENLYVVEQAKKGIRVIGRKGETIRFITDPSVERPSGIAIDRERGKIYLADTAHTKSETHNVKIFNLEGELVGTVGRGKGSGPGEFLFPTYVSVDAQGNLYVTDTLNSRVQLFDSGGNYVRNFGERGTSWGMFDKPKGVATDSFGNVYVVDSGWSNVQIFNPKGQVLLFFGGRGPIPGMLKNPTAIAIDKQNRIYVADYLNHRVEMYRLVNTTSTDSFLSPAVETKANTSQAEKKPAAKK